MRTVRFLAALAVLAGSPAIAAAQDAPKTGIVIAYPTAFGVLWHASDKIAIRPEFSVSGNSTTVTGTGVSSDISRWGAGFGVSALFYLNTEDSLRTYIVPRFFYAHSSSSGSSSASNVTVPDSGSDNYGGSGSFGAQYGLGKRFALFGELGFGYERGTSDTTGSLNTVKGSSWGLRSGVGVVFYP